MWPFIYRGIFGWNINRYLLSFRFPRYSVNQFWLPSSWPAAKWGLCGSRKIKPTRHGAYSAPRRASVGRANGNSYSWQRNKNQADVSFRDLKSLPFNASLQPVSMRTQNHFWPRISNQHLKITMCLIIYPESGSLRFTAASLVNCSFNQKLNNEENE